jgi:nicotianamine synthase
MFATPSIIQAMSVVMLPSVKPSPHVNTVFSRLVFTILNAPLLHKRLGMKLITLSLRTTCTHGEFALEEAWAKKILSANDAYTELLKFPYYKNYECLTAREWRMVTRQHAKAKNVIFLGSGPLPLTAIILAKKYGCNITLVDSDTQAVLLSHRLIQLLGLSQSMRVVQASAETYQDVSDVDIIYVAALVGRNPKEELRIYKNLAERMNRTSLLLVRSAHGSRTLLYRPVSKMIDRSFSRIAEMHPHDDVVNSAILLRPYA